MINLRLSKRGFLAITAFAFTASLAISGCNLDEIQVIIKTVLTLLPI